MEATELFNKEQYEKALAMVDTQRRERVSAMKQEQSRALSLAAGLLLSYCLRTNQKPEAFGDDEKADIGKILTVKQVLSVLEAENGGMKQPDFQLAKTPEGKPYLVNQPGLSFNLSHSGAYAACVFADKECGVDIQKWKEPVSESLEKRVFHENEHAFFFDVWAAKEAYCKCTGQGLAKDMRQLYCDFANGKIEDTLTGTAKQLYLPKILDGYSVAVCIDRAELA